MLTPAKNSLSVNLFHSDKKGPGGTFGKGGVIHLERVVAEFFTLALEV